MKAYTQAPSFNSEYEVHQIVVNMTIINAYYSGPTRDRLVNVSMALRRN